MIWDNEVNSPFLQDLHEFKREFERSLQSALQCLKVADTDLFHALQRVSQQLEDLVQFAGMTVIRHWSIAYDILCGALPSIRIAAAEGRWKAQVYFISVVQGQLAKMKRDCLDVRAAYLDMVNTVKYVITCTELELDFAEAEHNEDSSVCIGLQHSLHEMRFLYGCLVNPLEFWLIFHIQELGIGSLEHAARQFSDTCEDVPSHESKLFQKDLQKLCLRIVPRAISCPMLSSVNQKI
jgi:hypothetical protein